MDKIVKWVDLAPKPSGFPHQFVDSPMMFHTLTHGTGAKMFIDNSCVYTK